MHQALHVLSKIQLHFLAFGLPAQCRALAHNYKIINLHVHVNEYHVAGVIKFKSPGTNQLTKRQEVLTNETSTEG